MSYSDESKNPIENISDLYQGRVNDQEYDLLVFIGRFQPFHFGHKKVIDIALKKAKKVLVLVGSSFRPARPRNPWSFYDRKVMIDKVYSYVPASKLIIRALEDFTYRDEMWITEVQDIAASYVTDIINPKIGLIGCSKDHSSYYLNLFPQWGSIKVKFLNPLNSTDIRDIVFSDDNVDDKLQAIEGLVPQEVSRFLYNYILNSESYFETRRYFSFCKKYLEKRQNGVEFPVQDITADAVVIQSGHILLVERKSEPGRGLLALPGGYVNPTEKWLDTAIRELREETCIKVPEPVLRGSITDSAIFDDPNRSERGRIVTQAFKITLPNSKELPKIKGGDDAAKAFWVPLSAIRSENMFEDHYDIIQFFLK